MTKATPESRFWAKVHIGEPDECWLWTGATKSHGYGYLGRNGKTLHAHRYAFELEVGPIPEGFQVDHLCFNRACVNPSHLEAVPPVVNMRRAAKRNYGKVCRNGHPKTEANIYVTTQGVTQCRACHKDRERERRGRSQGPCQIGNCKRKAEPSGLCTAHRKEKSQKHGRPQFTKEER